ncbi:MAG: Gfo/Idh/MocA family protein [Gemmatimonadales bacterium]
MRILIAGLGAIGQRHARNLRALRGGDIELMAYRSRRLRHVVTDTLTKDETRDVEAELGVRAFDDLDAALGAKPDAVFICTPSSRHLDIAQRAAEAGCHLFIEKPVSNTMAGVERLRATAVASGLVVMVGSQWRFHPCVRALRAAIEGGTLGRLVSAEITYAEYLPDWHPYEDYRTSYAARAELGGGVVLTQIHDYDLACWLFGTPRRVTATGGMLGALEIDVEDTVDARLEGGRAPVRVRQTFAARPPVRTIMVTGERGSATLDMLGARLSFSPPLAPEMSVAEYQRNRMFVDEAASFLESVGRREPPAVTLDDGITALRVALAVKESMQSQHTVDLT